MQDTINPKLKANINIKKIEKEIMVYDPDNEKIHIINETAGKILDFCNGEYDVQSIAAQIASQYNMQNDQEAVSRDVEEILHSFRELGILIAG